MAWNSIVRLLLAGSTGGVTPCGQSQSRHTSAHREAPMGDGTYVEVQSSRQQVSGEVVLTSAGPGGPGPQHSRKPTGRQLGLSPLTHRPGPAAHPPGLPSPPLGGWAEAAVHGRL